MLLMKITCFLLIFKQTLSPSWLDNLRNNIKDDFNRYQVILILDNIDSEDLKVDYIVEKISKNCPTQVYNTKKQKPRSLQTLTRKSNSLENLKLTTLFIVVGSPQSSLPFTEAVDLISQLSTTRIRPNCLVISLQKVDSSVYKRLLRFAWSRKFLDFTVLTLSQKLNTKGLFWENIQEYIATLHYFNPFTKLNSNKRFSNKTTLFPDKTLSLNGFNMKAHLFENKPVVGIRVNPLKGPIETFGNEARLTEVISQKMNFSITYVIHSRSDNWGKSDCNIEETTGLMKSITHSWSQFVINHGPSIPSCKIQIVEITESTGFMHISAVAPIFLSKTLSVSTTMQSAYMLFFTVLIVATLWATARALKLDVLFWTPANILTLMIGMDVTHSSEKISDRILLSFSLLAFSIYSSYIYVMVTDILLKTETLNEINTLQDLLESGLTPMMKKSVFFAVNQSDNKITQALLKKSVFIHNNEECFDLLLNYRNVTCFITESLAKATIGNKRNSNGVPITIIVKEYLNTFVKGIVMEPNSPYVDRFSQLLSWIYPTGLNDKWSMEKWTYDSVELSTYTLTPEHNPLMEDIEESETLNLKLAIILFVGFTISTIVFISELLIDYLKRRKDAKEIMESIRSIRTQLTKLHKVKSAWGNTKLRRTIRRRKTQQKCNRNAWELKELNKIRLTSARLEVETTFQKPADVPSIISAE